jgi:signal transduction histidine kinase
MTAAQLLLLGFIVYWLAGQYDDQKKALLKEMNASWTASEQQMMDSVLMKEFIHPVIDSNKKVNFRFEFNTDSLHLESLRRGEKDANGPCRYSKVVVKVADTVENHRFFGADAKEADKSKLILKSVKLIVNEISDSSGNKFNIASWSSTADTNLMKKAFRDKLKEIDPRLKIGWATVSDTDTFTPAGGTFYFTAIDDGRSLKAGVTGFRLFLIRKMLPQLLFALFLLALTMAAFIMSFRSYKAQLMLNRQRNDFMHNMSHELKTPVATVKVALEALKDYDRKSDPVKMNEYLDMAVAEAGRLEMLINRVMQFPENANGYTLNLAKLDLRDLLNDTIRMIKPRLEKESAALTLKMHENLCMISADALHIQGVLLNLLDNSLKYCTGTADISVDLGCDADYVNLIVTDKGREIPPEYRDKIFDKFFRVPNGDVHNIKGYGLGLSYARSIMELHGGQITYKPGVGVGNGFMLTFPKLAQ